MDKTSKIYIAGHRGMVGSAIERKYRSLGYTNIITRTRQELDLLDQQAVQTFFQQEKPEYVILAAAKVGGIIANNTYRAQFIFENIQIQNNVIHQSYLHGVKKLLFLGSSCIYPKLSPQPMKEDSLLTDDLEYTNEPYAIAKIAGMKMCEEYNLQYGTNYIAVMPTNLYGPNDNYDLEKSHVLPALIRKMHLGKCLENNDWNGLAQDLNLRPIEGTDGSSPQDEVLKILEKYGITRNNEGKVHVTLWGTGHPKREFLHSDDMADACVYLMENTEFNDLVRYSLKEDQSAPEIEERLSQKAYISIISEHRISIKNTHINIGTGKDLSIKELAVMIKQTTGYQGEIIWDTSKPDGTPRKLMDVSKINALGWSERISLEEGIKMVYERYREMQ